MHFSSQPKPWKETNRKTELEMLWWQFFLEANSLSWIAQPTQEIHEQDFSLISVVSKFTGLSTEEKPNAKFACAMDPDELKP